MKIKIYGKDNCKKCDQIKKKLNALNNLSIDYVYFSDEKLLQEKVLELKKENKLIEMVAPIILIDELQIKHSEFIKLI